MSRSHVNHWNLENSTWWSCKGLEDGSFGFFKNYIWMKSFKIVTIETLEF
jgi:hypothetical protein